MKNREQKIAESKRSLQTIIRVILDGNYESLNLKLDKPTKLKIITRYIATKDNPINLDDKIEIASSGVEIDYDCFGVMTEGSEKSLKFTLDFKAPKTRLQTSSRSGNSPQTTESPSAGHEKEEVLLLGRPKKCLSSPVLLCSDSTISGSHGVSIGVAPEKSLDYLKSRSLSEKAAKKLLIKSRFKGYVDEQEFDKILGEILA